MTPRDPSIKKKRRQRRERRHAFPAAVPKAVKRAIGRTTTQETPLHVQGRGAQLDDALRDYVRSRTGFKLGKYGLHLTRITVRIENVAGPKGAPTYTCRFKVLLPNLQEVVISATDAGARAAFDKAADATERGVRRLLERTKTLRSRRPRQ
jgi:ribosome-associated translation inhibitor RaiA